MQFRLALDRDQLDRARKMAREIATHLRKYIDRHTSVAIERAALRSMGVHGQQGGQPLPHLVVERIGKERLRDGAAYWLGYVMWERKCDAQAAAQHVAKAGFPEEKPKQLPHNDIRRKAQEAAASYFERVAKAKQHRGQGDRRWGARRYVVVQTGDLQRDCDAIHALVKEGIDGVVLRPPLKPDVDQLAMKSGGWRGKKYDLFDAIAHGASATREAGARYKTAPCFIWGGVHIAAPEVLVAGAPEAVHAVEYDGITATRVARLHFKRALVDQQFCFRCCAMAGIDIHVASEQWVGACDGYQNGHELLVGMLLIEAMGEAAGLALESISPRHPLIATNGRADRLVLELAQAQLVRELFPQVPVGFADHRQPSTVEDGCLVSALASLCDFAYQLFGVIGADKQAVTGMMTSIATQQRIGAWLGELTDDLSFVANGKIMRRTHALLERVAKELSHLHHRDFLKLVEHEPTGLFHMTDTGAGIDGVIQKGKYYWNPVEAAIST